MNILKYIWYISINLFKLYLITLIMLNVNIGFERLILSLIILIYITIDSYIITDGFLGANKLILITKEFINIKILLKDPELVQDYNNIEDIYSEKLGDAFERIKSITPRFYINAVFTFIFYILILYYIFNNIQYYS